MFFSCEVSSSIIHNVALSEWVSECLSLIEQSWNYPLYVSVPVHSSLYTCTINWFPVHLYCKLASCTLLLQTGFLYTFTVNWFLYTSTVTWWQSEQLTRTFEVLVVAAFNFSVLSQSLLGLFSLNKWYWFGNGLNKWYWTSNGCELEPDNFSLDTRAWQYRAQKMSVALPVLALLTWTGITSWRTSRWKWDWTGFSTAWRKHKF